MTVREVAVPTAADRDAAWDVVSARLAPTPVVPAPALGDDVYLKLETLQPTGSFKVRGALAALSRADGGPVVMASAGNAGLGVAWAAAALGVAATVVVAETASPAKVAALRALPVTLVEHGADYDEAEAHALALAAQGAAYVSSYNDTGMIAGQSTVGRELESQLPGPVVRRRPARRRQPRGGARLVGVGPRRRRARRRRRGGALAGDVDSAGGGGDHADRGRRHARRRPRGNLEPGAVTFGIVRDHVDSIVAVRSRRSPRACASSRAHTGSWPRARERRRSRGCWRGGCRAR